MPIHEPSPVEGELVLYDAACRAMAAAKSVDEVLQIRDRARALEACARVAKNKTLKADAVVLRMRATRRLDQMRQSQKETVGLATGGEHGGRRSKDGVRNTPSIPRPTLASQGVDKNLAKQARALGALSDEDFESVVADARGKVARAVRNAVREVEILQERESYAGRTEQGCTVDDLEALAASGFKAGVIVPDFPWSFEVYSAKGKQRSADRHYGTWSLERILAMGPLVRQLAADDCAFMSWGVCPEMPGVIDVITACGFEFKTFGFFWLKTTPSAEVITLDGDGLHWGMGYATRSNVEPVLLGTRGKPRRLAADVHQVVIAPAGAHSTKPDEVYRRIERLYPGPYLELFARQPRPRWTCWGNEIARDCWATNPDAPPPPPSPPQPSAPADDGDDDIGIPSFLRRAAS